MQNAHGYVQSAGWAARDGRACVFFISAFSLKRCLLYSFARRPLTLRANSALRVSPPTRTVCHHQAPSSRRGLFAPLREARRRRRAGAAAGRAPLVDDARLLLAHALVMVQALAMALLRQLDVLALGLWCGTAGTGRLSGAVGTAAALKARARRCAREPAKWARGGGKGTAAARRRRRRQGAAARLAPWLRATVQLLSPRLRAALWPRLPAAVPCTRSPHLLWRLNGCLRKRAGEDTGQSSIRWTVQKQNGKFL